MKKLAEAGAWIFHGLKLDIPMTGTTTIDYIKELLYVQRNLNGLGLWSILWAIQGNLTKKIKLPSDLEEYRIVWSSLILKCDIKLQFGRRKVENDAVSKYLHIFNTYLIAY